MIDAERVLTVLVVDDEALLCWSIATLLRQRGHTVIEAATADAARRAMALTAGPIDIMFLDYCLPEAPEHHPQQVEQQHVLHHLIERIDPRDQLGHHLSTSVSASASPSPTTPDE